jgi:hypothetical protein
MNMWPDVVLVHGRPRHPQTQGSIERANQDIEPMIGNWMIDNNTKNWVLGLNFVQIAKNTRYHSGVGNKPYTLQYGQQCRYGCVNLPVDKNVLQKLRSEDDLNQLLTSMSFVMPSTASPEPTVTMDMTPVEAEHGFLTDTLPAEDEHGFITDTPPAEDEHGFITETHPAEGEHGFITETHPVEDENGFITDTPLAEDEHGFIMDTHPIEDENGLITDSPLVEAEPERSPMSDTPPVIAELPVFAEGGQLSCCATCNNPMTHDYECIGCGRPVHWFCASGDPAENEEKGHGKHYWCHRCNTKEACTTILVTQENQDHDTPLRGMIRSQASASQVSQSERMKKRFREDTMQDVTVGSVCLVPIDKVDRTKIDPKRLPCVVVEITAREQYRLACKAGVLDKVLQRQDFLHESNKTPVFYGLNEALQNWRTMKKISIRTGSGTIAPSGGQGHLHCNCSGKCDTKRCGCLRGGQKCNSRCHPANSKCCNKCQ